MSEDGLDQKLSPRPVHATRHFLVIFICLLGTTFIDLSGYPETPAVMAYSAMLIAMTLTGGHWIYTARHKYDLPEQPDENLQN